MIDKQILNYIITNQIGKGGMATVYKAVHKKFKNRKVAIKVLNPMLAADENIRQRFENEATIMAGLEHQNITQVIDLYDETNNLAIVMELLEGQSLSEHIHSKGVLTKDETNTFFNQMLDAFAFAHQNGIAHRDVKPSNIFIEKNGNVKILDFGIAKILGGDINLSTVVGAQMGTLMYMSPEQIRDSKDIDIRSDIYSLGVVLFYMINGKPPYDPTTTDNLEIRIKIAKEPLPELTNYPEFNKIIKNATAKNRDERYQTCEEFMYELQNIEHEDDVKSKKEIVKSKVKEEEKRKQEEEQRAKEIAELERRQEEEIKKQQTKKKQNQENKFTDSRDGKIYKTVKIGNQVWFAENLAYKASSGCWAYDDDQSNVNKYGYLYDWKTAKKVCPTGWHLPTNEEWATLTSYLGGEEDAGEKLKS